MRPPTSSPMTASRLSRSAASSCSRSRRQARTAGGACRRGGACRYSRARAFPVERATPPVPLVLHNTLTRRKQAFEPLVPDRVSMYVCGPTVYDFAHIGNARPAVVFDVLYRVLKRRYAHVTYVRNITDVEDKINTAAAENNEPI